MAGARSDCPGESPIETVRLLWPHKARDFWLALSETREDALRSDLYCEPRWMKIRAAS
jgi:hypothetical protein